MGSVRLGVETLKKGRDGNKRISALTQEPSIFGDRVAFLPMKPPVYPTPSTSSSFSILPGLLPSRKTRRGKRRTRLSGAGGKSNSGAYVLLERSHEWIEGTVSKLSGMLNQIVKGLSIYKALVGLQKSHAGIVLEV